MPIKTCYIPLYSRLRPAPRPIWRNFQEIFLASYGNPLKLILAIPAQWFSVDATVTFTGQRGRLKTHLCQPPCAFSSNGCLQSWQITSDPVRHPPKSRQIFGSCWRHFRKGIPTLSFTKFHGIYQVSQDSPTRWTKGQRNLLPVPDQLRSCLFYQTTSTARNRFSRYQRQLLPRPSTVSDQADLMSFDSLPISTTIHFCA